VSPVYFAKKGGKIYPNLREAIPKKELKIITNKGTAFFQIEIRAILLGITVLTLVFVFYYFQIHYKPTLTTYLIQSSILLNRKNVCIFISHRFDFRNKDLRIKRTNNLKFI
jgi:hypothetical protein